MSEQASALRSGKGHRDENFPVASRLIHPRHRPPIMAFYEFVRVADDMADHATLKPQQKLDRLDEAEAQLQSMRQNTLKEQGCVFMHLVQPQDDPDTWVMLEMFRSRAAWDEHMRQPYNTEGNKILEGLLREPSDLRLLDEK